MAKFLKQKTGWIILLLTILLVGNIFLVRFLYLQNLNIHLNKMSPASKVRVNLAQTKEQDIVPIKEEQKPIDILFVGDLMFDRYIRQVASRKGNDYIFSEVANLLKDQDLVVANLEGPITTNASKSENTQIGEKNHLVFTFDSSLSQTLYNHNIRVVNLGNNHILNFGSSGLVQTKDNLAQSNISYFGDASAQNEYQIEELNGTNIGLVNYNQFSSGSRERALENIKKMKSQVDYLFVYTHWGVEYIPEPKEDIKNLAHEFVDQGADLVIGTHPHVVETKEEYKNKMIYYSLGNFVFDQYFSPETQEGLGVKVIISPNRSLEFQEVKFKLKNNGQTVVDGV